MSEPITEIVNLVGDLETYADELAGEGWLNAANGCRVAADRITTLEAALVRIGILNASGGHCDAEIDRAIRDAARTTQTQGK